MLASSLEDGIGSCWPLRRPQCTAHPSGRILQIQEAKAGPGSASISGAMARPVSLSHILCQSAVASSDGVHPSVLSTHIVYRPAFPLGTRRGHSSQWAAASTCTELYSPGTLQLASAKHCVQTSQFSSGCRTKPCQGPAGPDPAAASMLLLSGQASPSRLASFLAGLNLLRRGPPPPGSDSHATGRPTPLERHLCRSVPSYLPGAADWAADCPLPQLQPAADAKASAVSFSGSPECAFTLTNLVTTPAALRRLSTEQHSHMCDDLSARIPMERKREVRPAQTEDVGHGHERVRDDSQILIGQALFQR
jgi:hypothetical protein